VVVQELIQLRDKKEFIKHLQQLHQYQHQQQELPVSNLFLPLDSHMILPVQRIPRYELLLRELVRHTEESHLDYADLTQALSEITRVGVFINEQQRKNEAINKSMDVSLLFGKQLYEGTGIKVFLRNTRQFLYEGLIKERSLGKQVHLFLFNDILVSEFSLYRPLDLSLYLILILLFLISCDGFSLFCFSSLGV
jgi:hypothetical protein